ncbi:Crp/Fnr family transcriptional regulator [Dokdonia ponticola]|uniref:Crp/Fnr family transcriptional regulator n=1 Tax=Dokdonia ponticola TaxID=2041041 RepID=A0ABV9HZG0_9FLAO
MPESNSLQNYLTQSINLTKRETDFVKNKLKYLELKKGDSLLNIGDVCSSVYFINTGSFYQYHLDEDFNIKVIDLYPKEDWMLNHRSFISRKPSQNSIEAFEDSTVFELSMESIHELIAISQSFLRLGKILDMANNRLELFDNNKSADEKYRYILTQKPMLIQKFPLAMIASYLKISPETLSRVRKRIN